MTSIIIGYTSVDGARARKTFKTLAAARAYATKMVGVNPDTCGSYAVSDDGVGKVTVVGVTLAALFGHAEPITKREAGRFSLICGDHAFAYGGAAYMVNTEDGPQTTCDWFCGLTVAGLDYTHAHRFGSRYEAQAFADKVNARGTVAFDLWTKVEPYDREAEAAADWQDEQDDRRAWGA